MQLALFDDGGHAGPLFEIRKRRLPKHKQFRSGWERRNADLHTPAWADLDAIKAVYAEQRRLAARDGPRTWCVDHIYPLNHPKGCGLHVANNLQIIPYKENERKSNHWPDDVQLELL